MKFVKDKGFVIRRRNLGDADRIVTIFSKYNGKVNIVAKGVRKITSRRGGSLEPLNFIDFTTVRSYTMPILTEVELISSFENHKRSLDNYHKIFIVCELIDSLCAEYQQVMPLYERLIKFAFGRIDNASFSSFKTDFLVGLGYWNTEKKFQNEDESYRYIESLIERKLKSRSFMF